MAKSKTLDLSKFKYIGGDDKRTRLKHAEGHLLTLAHGSLSSDTQSQLKTLRETAEGDSKNLSSGATKSVLPEQNAIAAKDEVESDNTPRFAKGGGAWNDITDTYNKTIQNLGYSQDSALPAPADVAPIIPNAPDMNTSGFDQLAESQQGFALPAQKAAELASATPGAMSPMAPMIDSPPPSTPADPSMLAAAAPPQADAGPTAGVNHGYQQAQQGITNEANAIGALGNEQAGILQKQVQDQQIAANEYKAQYTALDAERKAHIADIQAGHIDPEKYWDSHSKIASAIGMIIAGFNPTTAPNAAINFLKFQMEQNLQSQQKNLDSNQNLLAANLRQFGNLKDAQDMTRIMQADVVSNQLKIASAKAQSPLAKAAALKASGQLEMEAAQKFDIFAQKKALGSLQQAATQNPDKMDAFIAGLEATGQHDIAKDYRSRAVPGLGFANDPEGAKGVRTEQANFKTISSGVNELLAINSTPGKSLSLQDRAKVATIRNLLIGALRVPVVGPGAMQVQERELLLDTIPDVTALTNLDSVNKTRLQTVAQRLGQSYRNMAIANGLKPPSEFSQTAVPSAAGSRSQDEARVWLQANPNHPKAAAVRARLGIK